MTMLETLGGCYLHFSKLAKIWSKRIILEEFWTIFGQILEYFEQIFNKKIHAITLLVAIHSIQLHIFWFTDSRN